MSHFRERIERFYRKILPRRQKQSDIPPAASSGNITSEDSCAAASNHIQPDQSRDNCPVTSPYSDTSPPFDTSPASQQQLPAEQSLWDRAYDALAKENPGLVQDYETLLAREGKANSAPDETTPSLPTLHSFDTRSDLSPRQVQLNTVIQNGLERMEANKTTFSIAGHEFVLKEKIAKAASFLLLGKDLIGAAVKNSPQSSIVWSGVSLILILLTNPATADKANRDGFSYVTSRLAYYAALEPMLRRLGQNAGVDEALISAAHDHLVHLYQAILDFQLSSILRFYHSHIKTYARDTITSRNWEQTLLGIKTQEQKVNSDLAQINDFAARQELEHLNRTSEDTHATMKTMLSVATEHLAVSKEQLAAQLAAQVEAKREKLLAEQRKCLQAFWLKPNGNGATYDWYKDRVEARVEGTCKWFLQHENFQKWLSQESGPLLVSADPGCGKSVLAKYLIDHVLTQQSATICFFFFKDQDQNTIRQALCALLHQMFSHKEALVQHAMELYNKMGADMVQSEPSLWTILRDAVRDPQTGPVIFVIDALDECDGSQLGSLISNLERMFLDQQLANSKFKVLMTSRPYRQVVSKVYRSLQDSFPRIHIPGEEEFEAISQEIDCVIHHRVEQLARSHQLSDKIKSSLSRKLLAIEHRTYLWVYLVFDYLDEKGFKKTDGGIDVAIQTLPKTVNQAYDQILSRSQDDETVEAARKALSIILVACRPLTLSEMNIAMNLDDQDRGRSIYDLDLEQDADFKSRLRTLCGLFVNVHHDKIYFLHQTAREFLIQSSAPTTVSSKLQWHHSITTRHAHSILAEICMLYLDRLKSTDAEAFSEDIPQGALFEYSDEYWADHFREAEFEKSSAMVDLAAGLCTPDSKSHLQWASLRSERYDHRNLESSRSQMASIIFGRYDIRNVKMTTHSWWARFMPGWYTTRPESSANVLFASKHGLTHVTQLLLNQGAAIEARDGHGWTAMMYTANSGKEDATRLLIENGADIEAKERDGRTALMLAAKSGDETVTRLLLENGADIEAKDYMMGDTALMHAARNGHEAVTRLLLENGADIKARNTYGDTALMRAAESGHEAVPRLLLENGADIKARSGYGWTALMQAAGRDDEAIAWLLLENGADIEAKNDGGWTALIYAARLGHEAVTRLLLENGADVEAKDRKGRTALMIAAESGHEAVTRLLLENGADVEGKERKGRTALMLAAKSGDEIVIRLLLENGADVEAKDKKGWTALMIAAESGHEAVTRLLLENGADVEVKDKKGWTALRHAAQTTRQLLLDHRAKVEAKDVKGSTP